MNREFINFNFVWALIRPICITFKNIYFKNILELVFILFILKIKIERLKYYIDLKITCALINYVYFN